MKKLLLIILFTVLLPFVVNSKELCTITKGNGRDIGDELKCGTEDFYVVSSNAGSISLMAKYNLLVGDKIDVININVEGMDSSYCEEAAIQAGYNPYYTYPIFNEDYELIKCRVYEKINYEHVRQDERAVGTKLVNGQSVLPLYGIVYMNRRWGYDAWVDGIYYENEYDNNGDLIISTTGFGKYLDGYKDELQSQGIDVQKVSFITLSKILKLLKDISGKNIVVTLEYPEGDDVDNISYYTGKMDIKDFAKENKWIYDVTYWLGSGFYGSDANDHQDVHNDFYMSNEGILCALGRGECRYLPYPIGNGIRPLVVIPENAVAYNIKTITDGNGTIEVVPTAAGNDAITFKVTSKKGYKLSKLIITTDSGEQVVFSEGSIVNNDDGTISINNNAFTMPYESVTIEARWTISNPKTGNIMIIICLSLLIVISSSIYILSIKEKKQT